MKVVGEIMFPNGQYRDRETGEEKTRWIKLGTLLESDKGFRIKMDVYPVNPGDGWFQVFRVQEQTFGNVRNEQQAAKEQQHGKTPDIPF